MLNLGFRGRLVVPIGVLLLVAAGCGSSPTSPSPSTLSVAGAWNGTAQLPNPYDVSMSLQQNSGAVSGTMRIAGVTGQLAISGTVASANRTVNWQANDGCGVWSGVLTVAGDGSSMSGPVKLDRSGCTPALSNASGTFSLARQ